MMFAFHPIAIRAAWGVIPDRPARMFVVPTTAIALTTLAVLSLNGFSIIGRPYLSPFVMAACWCSHNSGLRAGMIAGVLAFMAHQIDIRAGFIFPTEAEFTAYGTMLTGIVLFALRGSASALDAIAKQKSLHLTEDAGPLPFVCKDIGEFWNVHSSCVWADDDQVGLEYGRLYVDRLRRFHCAPLLAWIIADMVQKGRFTGLEAGFLHAVEEAARRSEGASLGSQPRQ